MLLALQMTFEGITSYLLLSHEIFPKENGLKQTTI